MNEVDYPIFMTSEIKRMYRINCEFLITNKILIQRQKLMAHPILIKPMCKIRKINVITYMNSIF